MYSTFSRILFFFIAFSLLINCQSLNSRHDNSVNLNRPGLNLPVHHPSNGQFPENSKNHSGKFIPPAEMTIKGAYLPQTVVGDTIKYIFEYDGYYHLDRLVTQTLQNIVWVNLMRDSYSYDENGNMTILLHQIWENNSWVVTSKRECQYDSLNRLFAWYEDIWENNLFRPVERYFYFYDLNGNLIRRLKEVWFLNDWVNSSQLTWTYDLQNNELTRKLEYFVSGSWQNSELHTWTYDDSPGFLSWTFQYWDNNQWNNSEMETYTRDIAGNMLTWLYHHWENSTWTVVERGEFLYDISGNMLTKLFQFLENGNWLDYARYTYNYDTHGNAITGHFHRKDNDNNIWYSDWGLIYLYYNYMSEFNIIRATAATATYILNPTGIEESVSSLKSFSLSQNYPNPFNPSTIIKYSIQEYAPVKLSVYDPLGKELEVLVEEVKSPGDYSVVFDAKDYPSGIYFYKLDSGTESIVGKMILLR